MFQIEQAELYHFLFYICLGICILGAGSSAVLFFLFDISHILQMRSRKWKAAAESEFSGMFTANLINGKADTETETQELCSDSVKKITDRIAQSEVNESYGMFKIEKYILLTQPEEEII